MGMAGTQHEQVYTAHGLPFLAEYYADLEYADDGSLLITRQHVAYDPGQVRERVARVLTDGVAISAVGQGDPDAGRLRVRPLRHARSGGRGARGAPGYRRSHVIPTPVR